MKKEDLITTVNNIQLKEDDKKRLLQNIVEEKSSKKTINSKWCGAAAAFTILLIISLVVTPVGKNVYAYCQLVIYNVEDFIYGNHNSIDEYTTKIAKVQTVDNISLQLNDAMLDGSILSCSYTITSTDPEFAIINNSQRVYELIPQALYINGKKYTYISYTNSQTDLDDYSIALMYEYFLDDCVDIDLEQIESLDIGLELCANNYLDKPKEFNFDFEITNQNLAASTKTVNLNNEFSIDNVKINFYKMTVNPYSQKIYFTCEGLKNFSFATSDPNNYTFKLTGTNNYGDAVWFVYRGINSSKGYFEIHTYDENISPNPDVSYYDLQLEYMWLNDVNDVCNDELEGTFKGKTGTVGETFRINIQ